MSNLLLTFRHGNGNAVNVREAPGRALKNGEIVHQPDTGQVLICTDHDVEADSDEWAGAYPDAGTVWEAVNPTMSQTAPQSWLDAERPCNRGVSLRC